MKQINQEKQRLKVLMDDISATTDYTCVIDSSPNSQETYFIDSGQEPFSPLMEYEIEYPVHLREYLEELWKTRHTALTKLIPVVMVAAFKNRDITPKDEPVISDYLYEF